MTDATWTFAGLLVVTLAGLIIVYAVAGRYILKDAPTHILTDILNSPNHCQSCDGWMVLTDPNFPLEPIRPQPTARKVRTPDNPKTHFQGFKWWPDNVPFSATDIIDDEHR